MLFEAPEPPKLLENAVLGAFSPFSEKVENLCKNGPKRLCFWYNKWPLDGPGAPYFTILLDF